MITNLLQRASNQRPSSGASRSLLAALLQGAPRNSVSRQVSTWAPLFSVQYWAYRFPLAYALWRELRTVLRRTASLHEIGAVDNGLHLGNPSQESRASNDDYLAHIEGIRKLRKHLPWVTLFDDLLFLEGMKAGLEFRRRNRISKSLETASAAPDEECNPIAEPRLAASGDLEKRGRR
jgi:hypothetical protein